MMFDVPPGSSDKTDISNVMDTLREVKSRGNKTDRMVKLKRKLRKAQVRATAEAALSRLDDPSVVSCCPDGACDGCKRSRGGR